MFIKRDVQSFTVLYIRDIDDQFFNSNSELVL